jgi:hypothetical protein
VAARLGLALPPWWKGHWAAAVLGVSDMAVSWVVNSETE